MCSPPARAPCFHSLSVFSPMAAIRARVPPRRPPPPANGSLKSSSARRWRKSCRPERSRPDLTAVALHIGETDCVAGVVGFELRCAERIFISLRCRVSSDSGAPAETAAVPRENDLLRWAGPFPHRGRRLAHIANRAPSGRPASHQSSNPLTQAGRIRTSMGRKWIQRLQAAPRCNA
jgi:hypothetical protein